MSENKQTTDSDLLLQIVGYNSEAFEHLYNRYSVPIYSLIKEIVSNPKLAEKILLNVFSVFLKRIDYYSTASNVIFTWLTLLARNISIDTLKRMKFVEDIPIYSDDYEIEFILPNLSQVIDPINFEERIALGEKIKEYKSHLTEVQTLVLSLVYFEGLNGEEIAKRLSVPVVTVRQKILSIMENLHHQFTGHTEDVNSNKKVLSLIKLEALGCLSSEERALFNEIRKNDPDFLWKELGEYQNLTALLATTIPLENPENELSAEIRDVFTKILQGSEVDYPIIAPEPDLIKQFQEPIEQQIQNPIPEVIKQPETQEKKNTEFELKFRERDPKELSLLKKIEPAVPRPEPVTVTATKKETEIIFRNQILPDKKLLGIADNKNSSVEKKETITAVINNENSIQKKISTIETEKPNLQIKNDDPSIVVEEPRHFIIKEESNIKNRLIPNSSINLKELLKKDESPVVSREFVSVKLTEEKRIVEKPVVPVVQKSDIIIKTNEPPKEFRTSSVFVDKKENLIQSKPIAPVVQKPPVENKINEPVKEIQKPSTESVTGEKKVVERPVVSVVQKSDIIIKTNESPKEFRSSSAQQVNQKEKINPEIKKDETLFKHANSPVDRSSLKIRETFFMESKKKTEALQQETSVIISEPIPKSEKTNPPKKLTEAINIDETLSKIEDEKPEPVIFSESESYEKEVAVLQKKIKKNILVSAAIFIVLALASLFVYLEFKEPPLRAANKTTKSENVTLAGQTNFIVDQENTPEIPVETPIETITSDISEKPINNQKAVISKLPEISTKEESPLFVSNISYNSFSNDDKQPTQTAAAKTETILPLKEIKTVEEEPAIFIAVEEMPELIGGIKGLQNKIVYPEIAKRVGVEGKVLVQAIVDETGKVISVNTIKGIGAGCDEVALDAVRNSQFTPGKQRGKAVKTQITIPIVFKK